jgi:riboflavin kinase/FMN adenylyltransferase
LSIGRAKTFVSDHPLLVEAHILEEEVEDLAGKWLAMDFVERLRPQRRFEKREDLKQQIARDCRQARQILDDIDRSQRANDGGADNPYG